MTGQGYTAPTPIQARAIPQVLEGVDLLAAAQTGTGKTAAFVLPVLQLLWNAGRVNHRSPRALVLVPTRELAAQVFSVAGAFGNCTPLRGTAIYGGVSFAPQNMALRRGVDVVIATPGRLLDHVRQGTVDLSQVTMVVLDEADRMLDMGFIQDIRQILQRLPEERQNLMFSATFSPEIRELASTFLKNPAVVDVAPRNSAAERVHQVAHPVEASRKREMLTHLITSGGWEQVLVFARTRHGANRLAEQLSEDGVLTDAIHGSRTQAQRTRALQDFKRGRIKVLVATDIAARGLDIEGLPHVVNFDLPYVPEDYVHRIGRTGRAGMEGDAVSLVCRDEERLLAGIERVTGRRIERVVVEGFEPVRPMRRKPGTANVEVMGRGRSPVAEKQPGRQERPARSERPARQEWSEQPERRASRSTGAERGMAGSHRPSSPAHSAERPVRDGSRPLTRPLFGTQDG